MIFELKSSTSSAKIDSMGAQLISLLDECGTEYIWQRSPQVWANCSPLLFPLVGNCRDDKTIIEGKTYEIPKHGFCKSTDFKLISQTDNSVTLGFDDSFIPDGSYPYLFEFRAVYRLDRNQLTLTLEVENRDNKAIYYAVGTHPGFNCPLKKDEQFEDYVLKFKKTQTNGYRRFDNLAVQFDMTTEHPFPGSGSVMPLNHELFQYDAIWFDRPDSREVSLVHKHTGKGIRLTYESYDTIAFWTLPQKEASYVCLEPWNGSAICSDEDDEFIHKNHIQKLDCNSSKSYDIVIQIL